jgi:NADH dehydrogenase FAD-containing subunit
VQPDLTIPGHGEVFVIGDLAAAISHGRCFNPVALLPS